MRFFQKVQKRLRNEESGFTLIELLIVLVIIGILLAIAVPSYLGFKKRAEQRATASSVRAAIPAAEAWYSDNGSYTGMTAALLKSNYDAGINSTNLAVTAATGTGYTLVYTKNGCTATFTGPGGTETIVNGGTCA